MEQNEEKGWNERKKSERGDTKISGDSREKDDGSWKKRVKRNRDGEKMQ